MTSLTTDHCLTESQWPDSAKLTANITARELTSFLAYAQTLTQEHIHPRPIYFPSPKEKANWADWLHDAKESDYYDNFRKDARRGANRLGFFVTWTRSWVGKEWKEDDWHCWGVAMLDRPVGYGKQLVMFDCDADMDLDFAELRPKDIMLPTQQRFISWARKYYHIESVWYGNAGCDPRPRQCVLNTAIWIESFAPRLEPKYQGPQDARLEGFVQIKRL